MANHSITSARNGLKIAVPLRPYGVLQRFASKGDNELIFTDPRRAEVGSEAEQSKKAQRKAAPRTKKVEETEPTNEDIA